jgi:hypothetical protein
MEAGCKNLVEAKLAPALSLQNKRKADTTSGEAKKRPSGTTQHTGSLYGANGSTSAGGHPRGGRGGGRGGPRRCGGGLGGV